MYQTRFEPIYTLNQRETAYIIYRKEMIIFFSFFFIFFLEKIQIRGSI